MIPEASAPGSLCVSVVLHDSALEALDATLDRLHASLGAARGEGIVEGARVVLHDNASQPAYRDAVQERMAARSGTSPAWLQWSLELSGRNPGFGVAHNLAQGDGAGPFLLILNPDVELARDAIARGLDYLARHPAVVALNPRCRRADGEPEYLCKRYPSLLDLLLRGFGGGALRARHAARLARYEYRDRDPQAAAPVELLSGACLLCRRDAFEAVGGFDSRFFLYFEDFDLSRRLAAHGELHYVPEMQVVHHGGNAARKGWRHRRWFIASALRFFARHGWRLR